MKIEKVDAGSKEKIYTPGVILWIPIKNDQPYAVQIPDLNYMQVSVFIYYDFCSWCFVLSPFLLLLMTTPTMMEKFLVLLKFDMCCRMIVLCTYTVVLCET